MQYTENRDFTDERHGSQWFEVKFGIMHPIQTGFQIPVE